jgi:micrococcal nuclease
LLRAGLAWPAERHNDPELESLKEEARQKNVGLWQEENPIPPWTFRREQTLSVPKGS